MWPARHSGNESQEKCVKIKQKKKNANNNKEV